MSLGAPKPEMDGNRIRGEPLALLIGGLLRDGSSYAKQNGFRSKRQKAALSSTSDQ
jgi:hypothetical protein